MQSYVSTPANTLSSNRDTRLGRSWDSIQRIRSLRSAKPTSIFFSSVSSLSSIASNRLLTLRKPCCIWLITTCKVTSCPLLLWSFFIETLIIQLDKFTNNIRRSSISTHNYFCSCLRLEFSSVSLWNL